MTFFFWNGKHLKFEKPFDIHYSCCFSFGFDDNNTEVQQTIMEFRKPTGFTNRIIRKGDCIILNDDRTFFNDLEYLQAAP